jgi:hypothetical protein
MTDLTPPTSGPPAPRCTSCGPWWRLPLLLASVLAAIVLARSVGGPDVESVPHVPRAAPEGSTPAAADPQPTAGTVSLAIDFGDGRILRYDEMPWHVGMTAEELLAAARRAGDPPRRVPASTPAHAGLTFVQRGSGDAAFLAEINGVAGEGAAGRNWVFFVNGRRSDRGFGGYVLGRGDRVLWRFVSTR